MKHREVSAEGIYCFIQGHRSVRCSPQARLCIIEEPPLPRLTERGGSGCAEPSVAAVRYLAIVGPSGSVCRFTDDRRQNDALIHTLLPQPLPLFIVTALEYSFYLRLSSQKQHSCVCVFVGGGGGGWGQLFSLVAIRLVAKVTAMLSQRLLTCQQL